MSENVPQPTPREDDRNEKLDDSPAPDPTSGESDAQDDPGAD